MGLTALFTAGFDNCEFNTSTLPFIGSSLSAIFQGSIVAGQNSVGALSIQNTGGSTAELAHVLPAAQSTMLWCGHIQIFNATAFTQQTFLIIGAAGTPLLQLQVQVDGTIRVLDGAGSLLGTTPAINLGTWYWLECNATYGVSAEIEIWLGTAGSSPTRVVHLTGVNLTSTLPDRFTIVWSSPSAYFLRLDNIQVYGAAALSDRNGPAAVTGQIVGALVNQGGWTKGAGTSVLQAVADRSGAGYSHVPDGTDSYDETGAGFLSFNPASSPCTGLVLAVGVNLVAKPIDPTPTISGAVRERVSTTVLGTSTVVDTTNTLVPGTPALFGFGTYEFFTMLNSAGENWNDFQILTAQWGAEASGDLLLTQVYLEKVFDLTGRKFGCGASSYAFTE